MPYPAVLLHSPQMGENIGAVARVMYNFGFTDLRIITPRDGWPNEKALEMAKSANIIIEQARVFDSLAQASEDLHTLYATTTRRRDMVKPTYSPTECISHIKSAPQSHHAGLLFGPERSGLSNDQLILCDAIVTIDTAPIYPSLNLSQAVGILCYSYFSSQASLPTTKQDTAPKKDLGLLLDHITKTLDDAHFFKVEEKRQTMLHNIHNIFTRSKLTNQEVRTLRGILRILANK